MANKMEKPVARANSGYDIESVANQPVHTVAGVIGRVWPRTGRVAVQVWRYSEIARLGHCMNLGIPEEQLTRRNHAA